MFENIWKFELSRGSHASPRVGLCAMEAVAWLEGEEHTDHPNCVSDEVGMLMRTLNDTLFDWDRQLLIPYLPKCVGTYRDGFAEERTEYLRQNIPRVEWWDFISGSASPSFAKHPKQLKEFLDGFFAIGEPRPFSQPVEERVRKYKELIDA